MRAWQHVIYCGSELWPGRPKSDAFAFATQAVRTRYDGSPSPYAYQHLPSQYASRGLGLGHCLLDDDPITCIPRRFLTVYKED